MNAFEQFVEYFKKDSTDKRSDVLNELLKIWNVEDSNNYKQFLEFFDEWYTKELSDLDDENYDKLQGFFEVWKETNSNNYKQFENFFNTQFTNYLNKYFPEKINHLEKLFNGYIVYLANEDQKETLLEASYRSMIKYFISF